MLTLHDALLISPLRRLCQEWRADAEACDDPEVRAAYQRISQDIERLVRGHDARHEAWAIMKKELLEVFQEGMREHARPDAPVNSRRRP